MTANAIPVKLAAGSLYRLRCAGDDIESRPQVYERALANEPLLSDRIAEFVQAWRTTSGAIAMYALMARRPAPVGFDALAFLRLVGRDIAANPAIWTELVAMQPTFADDCARLAGSLRDALATNTPTAYA